VQDLQSLQAFFASLLQYEIYYVQKCSFIIKIFWSFNNDWFTFRKNCKITTGIKAFNFQFRFPVTQATGTLSLVT